MTFYAYCITLKQEFEQPSLLKKEHTGNMKKEIICSMLILAGWVRINADPIQASALQTTSSVNTQIATQNNQLSSSVEITPVGVQSILVIKSIEVPKLPNMREILNNNLEMNYLPGVFLEKEAVVLTAVVSVSDTGSILSLCALAALSVLLIRLRQNLPY